MIRTTGDGRRSDGVQGGPNNHGLFMLLCKRSAKVMRGRSDFRPNTYRPKGKGRPEGNVDLYSAYT